MREKGEKPEFAFLWQSSFLPVDSVKEAPCKLVLIVEDEWLVRMEMSLTFREAGWKVVECASGEEAERLFAENPQICLVLTDIRLDGQMSGWDLAENLRKYRPDTAIIYASANPPRTDRQVSSSEFFHKPALMSAILEASERLL